MTNPINPLSIKHSNFRPKKDGAIPLPDYSEKEIQILDAALEMLIENGDAGLTLRKLAGSADMRLSNVQYYFKDRNAVLAAMIERYFSQCTDDLRQMTRPTRPQSPRERLDYVIRAGLSHGREISDMCRAFREIWAISSRDAAIDQRLMEYYREFATVLADFAAGPNATQSQRDRLSALLVPYFEGYSITARSLAVDEDFVVEMISKFASQILANEPKK